ncbi:MAG: CBS domain-containing protein [Caldilineaceae bacterium SB0670_bin_27]|uniref:CBS domain-containing protein n=1 Tax=Caldilineaceae bacterium SB0664_bin_27 TaxID=2605260 RepID=A0A6B0YRD5_9CHLR|nr:CBS domain-containing protein [Caldilineaceae bacterium SB0664_bin_27]MYJ76728.1 CBS domain-containing protein [Caldilineaceae bacterium SB0670_bin_27]
MSTAATEEITLTRKDFVSDQTVRWCPGCGDYSILAQMQRILPDTGVAKEKTVFISGIGCASRFPYYMNTYGIHSIHGRAPALATGLAIANPDLTIWVITGDGDGLSIGGNHLLHAIRRNVNLNIVLFNNRIYGLTKGQYSPTSRPGTVTKSSPMGSVEQPLNPIAVAMAAEATFVARSIDSHPQHLAATLKRAAEHKGASFLEIYQNCVIFNPNEWTDLSDRKNRDDSILYLEHGKHMIFGKDRDKGIRLNGFTPEVVSLDEVDLDEILVHDATSKPLASILGSMEFPDYPAAMGVIRDVRKPDYAGELMEQVQSAQAQRGPGDLNQLYLAADLWTVEEREEAEERAITSVASDGDEMPVTGLDEEYIDDMDKPEEVVSEFQDVLVTKTLAELKPKVPITVGKRSSLARTVRQMNQHNIGCMLVTDEENRLVGIFTEWDVLNRVAGLVDDLTQETITDYMTADPLTLKGDLPIAQALNLMSIHGFRHLPLVDDSGQPTGIISFRDVVGYLNEALEGK